MCLCWNSIPYCLNNGSAYLRRNLYSVNKLLSFQGGGFLLTSYDRSKSVYLTLLNHRYHNWHLLAFIIILYILNMQNQSVLGITSKISSSNSYVRWLKVKFWKFGTDFIFQIFPLSPLSSFRTFKLQME